MFSIVSFTVCHVGPNELCWQSGKKGTMSMQGMPAFSFTGTWSSVSMPPSFIGKNEP